MLHLIALLLLFLFHGSGGGGSSKEKGQGRANGEEGAILPKKVTEPEEVQVTFFSTSKTPSSYAPHRKDDCKWWFGGIGLVQDGEGRVLTTPSGYPAQLGGISVGDVITSPGDEIRGEVGTEVVITYQNESGQHTVSLIRDKICIDKPKPR